MAWSIAEVARMSGVTSRTLRHYDGIGLLAPAYVGGNGYRYYEVEQLLRLQQILLLRELGLGLSEIADAIGSQPGTVEALRRHHARLLAERDRLGVLARTVARTIAELEGGDPVTQPKINRPENLFEGFDPSAYEDLLANALLAHVGAVMTGLPGMPEPGTGTVAENLASFIETGLDWLARVAPAFAGMISQPGVLSRFHAMVGGDAAFGAPADDTQADEAGGEGGQGAGEPRGQGLPALLTGYLRAEQRLGRIGAGADIDAAVVLIAGAIHGQVLPRVLLGSPAEPAAVPPGLALRLAHTMLGGVGPGSGG